MLRSKSAFRKVRSGCVPERAFRDVRSGAPLRRAPAKASSSVSNLITLTVPKTLTVPLPKAGLLVEFEASRVADFLQLQRLQPVI